MQSSNELKRRRFSVDEIKMAINNDSDQVIDELTSSLKRQKQQEIDKSFEWILIGYRFRLDEIQRATNGFSIDNLLEESTCWKSYRGYLYAERYNGDIFVKRISKELIELGSYDFKQELAVLASCYHVNVISLLGYCNEENENIIVYKFMPNGLLYHYLYNNQHVSPRLSVKQCLDICIGVARGLSYLHTKNIIHGNLATMNIFLDHDLVPSISGMDKAVTVHHIKAKYIMDLKQGTEGYLAPECYEPGYKPSKQCDVYAFGILLLEVLCDKPLWKSLIMLALEFAMKGELPRIRHEPVEISIFEKCLRACENLIRECLDVDPDKRPSMKQAVDELELALKLQKNYKNCNAISQQVGSFHFLLLDNPRSSSKIKSMPKIKRFLLSDIKMATKDFSASNYLGKGAFGEVYKGNISRSWFSELVAVKRMSKEAKEGLTSFEKEIKLVSDCNHDNIISLLGFCDEEDEKILVYEFMSNGSLFDYLYKDKSRIAKLTIEQRLEICIGVAKGLDYLHSRTDYVIIHSDLKTDNILLDENLVPKISDFGLSRTRDAGPSTSKQITYHIQGTEGYLAPECYESNYQLSRKADVYAYGVVLLEVLCERPAWERLVILALPFIRRRNLPDFTPDYVARHISTRCSRACEHLIMECLDTNPDKRPDMNQVVTRIEEALRLEKEYSKDHPLPFTDPKVFSSCDSLRDNMIEFLDLEMNQVVTRFEEELRLEKEYLRDHLFPFNDPKVFSSSDSLRDNTIELLDLGVDDFDFINKYFS
ncbi:uncharacterized protein [Rutidosis leptorrhynchoides]|uniref:uncharacterized protein isoform X2 n=1 Tax=Rutidosis leptorrhynchoides TaxID=125765 RepID=UPI003A995E82